MASAQLQTQTQAPANAPVTVVKQHSFGTFAISVTLFIILAIGLFVYLVLRRQVPPKHVDQKAGDEGEDN
ncbi:hypothetical protein E4633_17430 [Geomonas terrae]|uniref:Uncharacterized protein n=1 Tax=Geomonas terrae TaxID=2562681 RepID=A0A4S1CBM9_9BACT|nr:MULTISPECIES: hypothetical protein [Geomonas]TGU70774.1 hypothetical protein E4633_17430 [Geomonas terrae]